MAHTADASAERGHRLRQLAGVFLKLGATSFGGPAAHIAMMEYEVVGRRAWLTRQEFLDLLAATNLIPGPNSTEMAIHIGHRRAGWRGLLVAGSCFILPAVLVTLAVAWLYVGWGTLPEAGGFLQGVKAAVLAVVLQALWRLGKSALRTMAHAVVGTAAIAATLLGTHELLVLLGGGCLLAIKGFARRGSAGPSPAALLWLPALGCLPQVTALAAVPLGLGKLFLFFLKTGSVLFGSGYVLLAFLRADLVERWGWLGEQQLLDAIAAGQVTPGPIFSTATFLGYVLAGVPGAGLATLGIFLPAFVFVALSGPLVPGLRRSPSASCFLDGVIAASLALMAVVTWQLGRATLVNLPSAAITLLSLVFLLRRNVSSAWLVLGGGLIGLLSTG